ncbi:MAG: hypothetical protein ACRD4Y_04495 [Candidatus Acidiferrales bacterium]
MRKSEYLLLLCAVALGAGGCANRHIVRAAPASVSTPPPEISEPMPVPESSPPPPKPVEAPPAEPAPTVPPMVPEKRPAPPRPRAPQPEAPAPKLEAPQISPQLSPKDLEAAMASTKSSMMTADDNLQKAGGRQLNAAQKDLKEKISSFLSQAHEAILADDWVRAQTLAEKARVLSVELAKSL